jgi:uncharacterized membrane protein (DUF4010 family)
MPAVTDRGFAGLLLALAIGFLIGIERGWRQREEEAGARVAGIRTFTLIGFLGGIVGLQAAGPLRYLALLLAAGAIAALLLGYRADMRRDHNVSATSTLAAIVTLGLGATATAGQMALASVGAGATVILLASRHGLHKAIRFTSESDLRALLRLVLVVLVVLPLLPDAAMGPYGALNPRRLWIVVVVTGAISFVGYGLARWLGQRRGALVTAAVGALVSSTAVTLDSARRIRGGSSSPADQAAVAIASLIMFGRAILLVALLAPFALGPLGLFIAPAGAVAFAASAVLLYRVSRSDGEPAEPRLKPPGLGLALLFAATVAVIALASAWAQATFGAGSGAVVIALGGTADIDAAIAAVGALPAGLLAPKLAALALAAPLLFNTLFKLGILLAIAGWRAALPATVSLATTALALLVPVLLGLAASWNCCGG